MGEDFQAEVCSSTWWNSPRGSIGFSPFLVGMNDFGSYGWPSHDLVEMKARSSDTRDVPNLIYGQGPILFDQNLEKLSEGPLIDSTSQMMDISCSSTITTTDWSQNLTSGSGCNEHNYQSPMMQENMSSQGFSLHSSLPMSSSSSYVYPSITMIENLFVDDQLPLENQPINIPSTMNYRTNLNEISRSLSKLPTLLTPLQNQQEVSPLQLAKNTPFWNASISTPSHDMSTSIFPSSKATTVEKPNLLNLKTKSNSRTVQDSKKNNAEPALKRPRIETPSSLPTFKVRKEKLGDRITALQQLVSPFGKTDTASVLQEALEYIRFLHDQVNALSTPYKKNGAPIQQQNNDNSKDSEGPKQDLRRRGLCLVPISSTFPIANETTVDFWTPTFGGTYR